MGLESASFISELDDTFPLGGDPINKGDDHLRLLKSVLQSQFPNFVAAAMNATVAELNLLIGLLASSAELNILDGALLSTSELNTLNGILADTSELNILNGATLSTAELNFVDGVTSAIQAQINGRAASAHSHTGSEISDLDAADTTTGAFADARIPNLNASKTNAGVFDLARIPEIDQAKLGANSVGQSEIKVGSQSISASQNTYVVATGGDYVIGHTIGRNSGVSFASIIRRTNDTSENAEWFVEANTSGVNTIKLKYINSSPPYDMGNGLIHQFIYAIVDNASGEIEMLSISPDPIWVYNGPTNCRPHRYDSNGKAWRRRKDMTAYPMTLTEALAAGVSALKDYSQAFQDAGFIFEEITQILKHADMNIISHPFISNDLTDKTPILIDPISPIMRRLKHLSDHDEANLADIVKNYLIIGNIDLGRVGPTNLLIPSVKWKLTA